MLTLNWEDPCIDTSSNKVGFSHVDLVFQAWLWDPNYFLKYTVLFIFHFIPEQIFEDHIIWSLQNTFYIFFHSLTPQKVWHNRGDTVRNSGFTRMIFTHWLAINCLHLFTWLKIREFNGLMGWKSSTAYQKKSIYFSGIISLLFLPSFFVPSWHSEWPSSETVQWLSIRWNKTILINVILNPEWNSERKWKCWTVHFLLIHSPPPPNTVLGSLKKKQKNKKCKMIFSDLERYQMPIKHGYDKATQKNSIMLHLL